MGACDLKNFWIMAIFALLVDRVSSTPLGRTVMLRGGVEMPSVGLGSSGGCGPDNFNTPDGSPCAEYNATKLWFSLGGRAVHTALSYCNQYGVGAAYRHSGLPRDSVFLMSMVPKYLMGYNETIASVRASLDQMDVKFMDLIMLHHRAADVSEWPREVCAMKSFPDQPRNKTSGNAIWTAPACALEDPTWRRCQDESWRALLDMRDVGLVRAVGVSNWPLSSLRRMEALGFELPAVNQIEAHIGYHEDDLIEFCASRGIVIQAATPLARSLPALVELGADKIVTQIAEKYKKSPAQVSLRYLVDRGIAPIPSAHTAQFQRENLDIFDFSLDADEVKALGAVVANCRGSAALGLTKCWADPNTMMCRYANGSTFHCP